MRETPESRARARESGSGAVYFADLVWEAPAAAPGALPSDLRERASAGGARRKWLVRGAGGFFTSLSEFAPRFRIPRHSHDHDELLVILSGSCRIEGQPRELVANDLAVLAAGTSYGIEVGAQGLRMLTIRRADAKASFGGAANS
jgi:quercetin dioxygenase-like cupin family protein